MTGVFHIPPGPTDADIEFTSDMAYFKDLAADIMGDLYAGGHGRLAADFLNRAQYLHPDMPCFVFPARRSRREEDA